VSLETISFQFSIGILKHDAVRSWIFRPEITSDKSTAEPVELSPDHGYLFTQSAVDDLPAQTGEPTSTSFYLRQSSHEFLDTIERSFQWSPVALFRFSALTFNGHMIHYSDPWCRKVENHPRPVVHGPLNLISIMDLWRDNHSESHGDAPRKISYRALAPLYAGDSYKMNMKKEGEKIVVGVAGGSGKLNMSAEITP
jgi:hypothetical protein